MSKLSKINEEEFVKLWNEGLTAVEMAKIFETVPQYIREYAQEHRSLCPARSTGRNGKINLDQFVYLWNEGVSSAKMAEIFGVGDQYIRKYAADHRSLCPCRSGKIAVKKNEVEAYEGKQSIGKVDLDELVKLWNAGESVKVIAKKLKISEAYAFAVAKRFRNLCPPRSKEYNMRIDFNELVRLWNEGVPSPEIARRLDASVSAVRAFAKKNRHLCPSKAGKRKSKILLKEFSKMWNDGESIDMIMN